MDEIQSLMQGVPAEVEAALRIVASGRPAAIKRYLPLVIGRVKTMAIRSAQLSNDTRSFFEDLMNLVAETMEATVSAKSLEQQELNNVKKEIENAKALEKGLESFRARLVAEQRKTQQEYDNYKADYKKALSEKPHGFMAFIMAIVHFFFPPQSYDVVIKRNCDFIKNPKALEDGSCVISSDFFDVLKSMDLLFTELDAMEKVLVTKNGTTGSPNGDLEAIKSSLLPPAHSVDETVSTTVHKSDAAKYLKQAEDLCDAAERAFPKGKPVDEGVLSSVKTDLSDLVDNVKPLEAAYCYATKERKPAKVEHFTGNWK